MNESITEGLNALRSHVAEGSVPTQALDRVSVATREADDDVKSEVMRALLTDDWPDDPVLRGYLAVTAGAIVESGGDPRVGATVILDRLAEGFEALRDGGEPMGAALLREGDGASLTTRQKAWVKGLPLHVVGAMARLARDATVRAEARAHTRLVAALRAVWPKVHEAHVYYIATVLDLFDDEPFLVVDLPEAKVSRCRAFGANKIDELTLALGSIRNEIEFDGFAYEFNRKLLPWQSLTVGAEGEVRVGRERPRLLGAAHPNTIPRFEGTVVIVRVPGSDTLWLDDIVRVHDDLSARVKEEGALDAEEARALLLRMARAADADPPPAPTENTAAETNDTSDTGEGSVSGRVVVLHADGTLDGRLTDPVAQSMLEGMAAERKAGRASEGSPDDSDATGGA